MQRSPFQNLERVMESKYVVHELFNLNLIILRYTSELIYYVVRRRP